MKAKVPKPRPLEERLRWAWANDHLPIARKRVEAPVWDEGFAKEFKAAVTIAERYLADTGYPHVALNPWVVLALKRRIETLESQNEALRQMKGVQSE